MNFDNTTIWIIGGFVVILIALIFSNKLKIGFNQSGLDIFSQSGEKNEKKANKIKVKGNENELIQDKNEGQADVSEKNNEIDLEGDKNKIEQDT